MVLAAATIVALPIVGTALATIPAIGEQLGAVMANLQLGIAGAFATAMAMFLYEMVMDGAAGVMGSPSRTKATA